ncbi:hypothetical protein [Mesoplasma florum]|uniref:hypothetical protein n=1 Tax=Mesoplasma florum TaxID=2151 RepID=UPI000D094D90|nr:hypothetical protein [Mesoplasma florum]AVN61113.1 hypothetical protein CG005_02335 [Mesoplasma florum]
MKKILKVNQNKFKNILTWFLMIIILIILAFMFKMINQAINGTSQWKVIFESEFSLINKTDVNWFANGKITNSFFTGPIGSKSFSEFRLLYSVNGGYIFLLPIFWDLLINWILIVGITCMLGFIIYELLNNNNNNILEFEPASNQNDKSKKTANSSNKIKKINFKKDSNVSDEEAHDFVSKMETKYKDSLVETAEEYIEEVNVKERKTIAKKEVAPKMSVSERGKIDGSRNIDEQRNELQKYSNKLRSIAIEKELSKKLQKVNLRNLTKKELIAYMKKVKNEIKN